MSGSILTLCTVPDTENAKRLARLVVEQKLAACVNLVPQITSIYEWQGQVEEDTEVLLLIKTSATQYAHLEQALLAAHPYDTPEIIAINIDAGLPDYLHWITQVTGS